MRLDGAKVYRLGSIEDRAQTAVYYRREQMRLFETMISVYSSAMSTLPEMRTTVVNLMTDYFEIVLPGSKEMRKLDEKNFVEKQSSALQNIEKLLADHAAKRKEVP